MKFCASGRLHDCFSDTFGSCLRRFFTNELELTDERRDVCNIDPFRKHGDDSLVIG